jgi:flagellar biosynthetic protein FliR
LQWIALLVDSYQAFPPGETWLGGAKAAKIAGFGASMFVAAVTIALPVTLVLLLVQLVAGVLSRSAPALNLFALGLPAGVLAGFAALIAAAPMVTDRMADLSAAAVESAAEVLTK